MKKKNKKFGPFKPVVNGSQERISAIKDDSPAVFEINQNDFPIHLGKSTANQLLNQGLNDLYTAGRTFDFFGKQTVHKYDNKILKYAQKHNIDPDLTRAVMYAENARGWYGVFPESVGASESILPMNIRKDIWSDLLKKKPEDIYDPDINIESGTVLLKRIRDRIDRPTPEKIGSIWNSAEKKSITEFGAYVGRVYKEKPWQKID